MDEFDFLACFTVLCLVAWTFVAVLLRLASLSSPSMSRCCNFSRALWYAVVQLSWALVSALMKSLSLGSHLSRSSFASSTAFS